MQWWVTHSFKCLPSQCPHPTCTTSSSNNTSNILKQTLQHLKFFIKFLMRKQSKVDRGTIWHFQFVWAVPASTHPPLTCWGGPGLFGSSWWGARGWLRKCLFVAVAYCWCCLISWLESYLFGCRGAAVALISWKAARFGQLSMSAPSSLSSYLSLSLPLDLSHPF